jgi:hypothetical protein
VREAGTGAPATEVAERYAEMSQARADTGTWVPYRGLKDCRCRDLRLFPRPLGLSIVIRIRDKTIEAVPAGIEVQAAERGAR